MSPMDALGANIKSIQSSVEDWLYKLQWFKVLVTAGVDYEHNKNYLKEQYS